MGDGPGGLGQVYIYIGYISFEWRINCRLVAHQFETASDEGLI